MHAIRVHLGPMPEMLQSIVHDLISQEPDILIVGRSALAGDCMREAREGRADIVIARDGSQEEGGCLGMVLAKPPLGVLVVSSDGHSASGVSLARKPIALGSATPVLACAIRRMAAELGAESGADHGDDVLERNEGG